MNKDVSAHTKRDRSKRNEEILGENRGIRKVYREPQRDKSPTTGFGLPLAAVFEAPIAFLPTFPGVVGFPTRFPFSVFVLAFLSLIFVPGGPAVDLPQLMPELWFEFPKSRMFSTGTYAFITPSKTEIKLPT